MYSASHALHIIQLVIILEHDNQTDSSQDRVLYSKESSQDLDRVHEQSRRRQCAQLMSPYIAIAI